MRMMGESVCQSCIMRHSHLYEGTQGLGGGIPWLEPAPPSLWAYPPTGNARSHIRIRIDLFIVTLPVRTGTLAAVQWNRNRYLWFGNVNLHRHKTNRDINNSNIRAKMRCEAPTKSHPVDLQCDKRQGGLHRAVRWQTKPPAVASLHGQSADSAVQGADFPVQAADITVWSADSAVQGADSSGSDTDSAILGAESSG